MRDEKEKNAVLQVLIWQLKTISDSYGGGKLGDPG